MRLLADLLRRATRKCRSLRSFWLGFASKLFANRAHMEKESTRTAAPSSATPGGRTDLTKSTSRLREKPHPTVCAWSGAVAPTSHFPTPCKTTRGEVVL